MSDANESDGMAEEAIRIGFALLRHPLSARFIQKQQASGDNRVYSAADVLGERIMRWGSLLAIAGRNPDAVPMNVEHRGERVIALALLAREALVSPAYLWTEEVRMAIAETYDPEKLPRHTISPRLLPLPSMWWTFETAITVGTHEQNGAEVSIDALFVRDRAEVFDVYTIGEIENDKTRAVIDSAGITKKGGLPFVECTRYQYGTVWPEGFERSKDRVTLGSVLCFMAFLNSPYIPKTVRRLLRAERREIARYKAADLGEEITFVTLRRPEPRRHGKEEELAGVDWKHRWIVSGHYRAQWYPSEAAHHVIWIAPYMKGPEDAPLIEHAYRVAR